MNPAPSFLFKVFKKHVIKNNVNASEIIESAEGAG